MPILAHNCTVSAQVTPLLSLTPTDATGAPLLPGLSPAPSPFLLPPPPDPFSRQFPVIGLIVRTAGQRMDATGFYSRILRAAVETIHAAGGFGLLLDPLSDTGKYTEIDATLEELTAAGARGFLLIEPVPDKEPGATRAIVRRGLPVVWVTEHPSLIGVPTVSYDNEHAGYLAALHLIETGCRRIVFPHPADIFTDPARQDGFPWLVQRLAGASRACERNGGNLVPMGLETTLHYQEEGDPRANWTEMGAMAAEDSARWVNEPGRAGIIAPNDWFALGLRSALMARGLPAGPPFRTPEEYSLVGFDNTLEAAEVGLSSIEPPVEILGQRAADLILDMISLRNAAPEVPLLKTEALRSVHIRPTLRPRVTTRGAVGGIGG